MSEDFDYLIVGQGLAGSCMAFTLQHFYKKRILIIDRDNGQRCSSIAAGTFNPLVFRTFSPTWRSPEFIPYLMKFYAELGRYLGLDLINPRSVFKLLKNDSQRKQWQDKMEISPSSQFMSNEILDRISGVIDDGYGFGKVLESGNINMKQMLANFRQIMSKEGALIEGELDARDLIWEGKRWKWNNIEVERVIFCQGHDVRSNPFFSELPLRETKGEVLFIKAKGWNPPGIIHNRINIVPLGEDVFWVGATYNWEDTEAEITQKAKSELLEQLAKTIEVDFEVLDHKAGIRPTVKDRRPIIGEHPERKGIYIFNGLGSRGVMLAPYFANQLASHIEKGSDLDSEVDLMRYIESE